LRALLDLLGIGRAHLVASSAGGPIGIVFAASYPKRTRALVLAGTALALFPVGDPSSDIVREQIALLDAKGPEAAFAARPGADAGPPRNRRSRGVLRLVGGDGAGDTARDLPSFRGRPPQPPLLQRRSAGRGPHLRPHPLMARTLARGTAKAIAEGITARPG